MFKDANQIVAALANPANGFHIVSTAVLTKHKVKLVYAPVDRTWHVSTTRKGVYYRAYGGSPIAAFESLMKQLGEMRC